MPSMLDAVVVGAGPNGLTAAVELARRGFSVAVFEARDTVGGGARTEELTLPGFRHDPCSAVHPLGIDSPAFRAMPLERYGLEWLHADLPMAHPFADGTRRRAVPLGRPRRPPPSGRATRGRTAGWSSPSWASGTPWPATSCRCRCTALPRDPVTLARFGLAGLPPSTWLMRRFRDERARALFAGLVAHVIAPLGGFATGAVGLVFALAAHARGWPVAARRLPVHLRRPRRVPHGPRRHHPHRLRGQAARRPAARARVRLRHLAHRAGPDRRPRPLLRRATGTAPPSSRSTTRWTARCRGPRRRPAGPAPSRSARTAARSAPPCAPRPERAAHPTRPFLITVQPSLVDPTRAPGGQARLLGVRPRPQRLDGRPHRRRRAPAGALRPGLPRPRPGPRHRRPAPARRPQRQLRRRRHRLRSRHRPPAPAAPQALPLPVRDPAPGRLPLLLGHPAGPGRARHVRTQRGEGRLAEAAAGMITTIAWRILRQT